MAGPQQTLASFTQPQQAPRPTLPSDPGLPPYTCYTCRLKGIIRVIGGKPHCRCLSKGMTPIEDVCGSWADPDPQNELKAMDWAKPSAPIDWRRRA